MFDSKLPKAFYALYREDYQLGFVISLQLFHRLSDDEDGDSDSEEILGSFEEIERAPPGSLCKITAKV